MKINKLNVAIIFIVIGWMFTILLPVSTGLVNPDRSSLSLVWNVLFFVIFIASWGIGLYLFRSSYDEFFESFKRGKREENVKPLVLSILLVGIIAWFAFSLLFISVTCNLLIIFILFIILLSFLTWVWMYYRGMNEIIQSENDAIQRNRKLRYNHLKITLIFSISALVIIIILPIILDPSFSVLRNFCGFFLVVHVSLLIFLMTQFKKLNQIQQNE